MINVSQLAHFLEQIKLLVTRKREKSQLKVHIPGKKDILENEYSGGRLITEIGFVIVIGILKRGPRQGALQSTPYSS